MNLQVLLSKILNKVKERIEFSDRRALRDVTATAFMQREAAEKVTPSYRHRNRAPSKLSSVEM